MSPADLARLPLVLRVEETAALLGIGRTAAYSAVKAGQLPSVRIGRRALVPRAALMRSLAHGASGIGDALAGFISMRGTLDLVVTGVLAVDDLALVTGTWSFDGTGPDGEPVRLAANNADVLRRQADGTWRFVIDNPWGTA